MAKYLITGGAGFIGGHLAEHLCNQGHSVCVFDDLSTGSLENLAGSAVEFIKGNIVDSPALSAAMADCDGVFHLAAVASIQAYVSDWAGSSQTNLVGCISVFEEAARANIPVVYASSAAVYGDPAELPLSERSPVRPISGYGIDKLANEDHAIAMGQSVGLQAAGLRFFNVYGPRQASGSMYSGVITIFLEKCRDRKAVTVFGDGSQTRDFIFVKDVVVSMQLAMEKIAKCGGSVFNICSGQSISINQLVETISECAGADIPIENAPRQTGDIQASSGSNDLASKAINFRAQTDLRQGLVQTIAWISKQQGQ